MAEIKECIGRNVKISKCSITIKDDNGKTRGIVQNIQKFNDVQFNKSMDYFRILKNTGAWQSRDFNVDTCIVKDAKMYVFRNMNTVRFQEKYGYFSEEEKRRAEDLEAIYNALRAVGIEVIECKFV